MAQKWNLQDIRKVSGDKALPRIVPTAKTQQDIYYKAPKEESSIPEADPDVLSLDIVDGNTSKKKYIFIVSAVVLVIFMLGIAVNIMLQGAVVTIKPHTKDISVQAEFTAHKEPKTNGLAYELLTLEAEGERQVSAAGKEKVQTQSEGKLFVYNTGTTPQRLVKNTRFETKDGLIFRIKESIEVPPAKKSTDSSLTPGSVAADVFADAPGEAYNIEPTRFTVPGLKGSDQFNLIYAESTATFTGGFDGEKYIIQEDEMGTALQELHLELRNSLLAKLDESKPAGFVYYDTAIAFTFETQPPSEFGESLATIKEKAILQVPLFEIHDFASFLARETIPDYKGDMVSFSDPRTLQFSYLDPLQTVSDLRQKTELTFMLRGTTRLIWEFNTEELTKKLLGIEKDAASQVFAKYPGIKNAQVEIRPFWSSTFPKDIKNVTVNTVVE